MRHHIKEADVWLWTVLIDYYGLATILQQIKVSAIYVAIACYCDVCQVGVEDLKSAHCIAHYVCHPSIHTTQPSGGGGVNIYTNIYIFIYIQKPWILQCLFIV